MMNGNSSVLQTNIIKQKSITRSSGSVDITEYEAPIIRTVPKSALNDMVSRATQEISKAVKNNITKEAAAKKGEEEDHEVGEIFGVILSRSHSVPSVISSNINGLKVEHEKQNAGMVENAALLKKMFSMRRSSSINHGYCRIHHQNDLVSDCEPQQQRKCAVKGKKKRGKFLAAFRFLGF